MFVSADQQQLTVGEGASVFCNVTGHPQPELHWLNKQNGQTLVRTYGSYTTCSRLSKCIHGLVCHINILHFKNSPLSFCCFQDSTGRVHAVDGVLMIDEIEPSDGGLYSCMAVSASGNASRDVAIHSKNFISSKIKVVFGAHLQNIYPNLVSSVAQPGPPHYLSVSPGPTSVLFTLKTFPISGGTPTLSFVLQWRKSSAEEWKEMIVSTTGTK